MYRNLFSPIQINRLEIKNRVAYPSLGLLYSKNGKLNDRYFNYFKERANGGAGLVTVGPVGVDFIGSGAIALSLDNDDAISDFEKLTGITVKAEYYPSNPLRQKLNDESGHSWEQSQKDHHPPSRS